VAGDRLAAFALIGDRYHNSDYIRTALSQTLGEGLDLGIDFTDETRELSAEALEGRRLLILFRDAFLWPDGYSGDSFWPGEHHRRPQTDPFEVKASSWYPGYQALTPMQLTSQPSVSPGKAEAVTWMTEAQGKAIKDFVADGGSALLYHNVTYIATENAHFRDVLGAATRGHPPIRPHRIQVTGHSHPITQGVADFVVTDEQHFLEYDGDPDCVLLRSINEDGLTHEGCGAECEAGWAHEYGKGRVCYLAPGHTIPALWNPAYVKIQQNAVRWLLGGT
jgi:type 1 glutamine amidotransferase